MILIIDDEPINVRVLEAIFGKEGFHTLKACSGADGRRLAESAKPDLILLDIMMPDESGFEACERLKDNPLTTDIPIIFLSALDDIESKIKGFSLGAVDYITKPFQREEVLARTRVHIKLREAYGALVAEQHSRLKQLQDAQQAILIRPQDLPDAGFAVYYMPVHEAGGDFYDVVRVSDGIHGYFIADVSGHNLGASFMTSALKALVRQNTGPHLTPLETVKLINSVMHSVLGDGQYLTACYVHLNRLRARMTVVSAGHPPIICMNSKGETELMAADGDVLGAFGSVSLDARERSISAGDRFFLYTDGMIERFGSDRKNHREALADLQAACIKTRELPLSEAVRVIPAQVLTQGFETDDDLLILGVEI